MLYIIEFNDKKHEARGSFILSRTGPIACFPNHTYACKASQLDKVKDKLEKEGITYTILETNPASTELRLYNLLPTR